MNGIDGSVDISSDRGNVSMSINTLSDDTRTVISTDGNVFVKIDPAVSGFHL